MSYLPRKSYISEVKIEEGDIWSMMRRVAMNQEAEIVGIHDPDNTNKWDDGSDVDWERYESDGWNCMVQIPKVYYSRTHGELPEDNDVMRIEVSGQPRDGLEIHPIFNRDELDTEYVGIGAFLGWEDPEGRLRSLPGKTPTKKKMDSIRVSAMKNSAEGYALFDIWSLSLIQFLSSIEFSTFKPSGFLGKEEMSANFTGSSLVLGNKSSDGTIEDMPATYRGVEYLYSNIFQNIDGISNLTHHINRNYTHRGFYIEKNLFKYNDIFISRNNKSPYTNSLRSKAFYSDNLSYDFPIFVIGSDQTSQIEGRSVQNLTDSESYLRGNNRYGYMTIKNGLFDMVFNQPGENCSRLAYYGRYKEE